MSDYSVIPSVNVFIIRGSQVLLGRRANTGWSDGLLCAPGGHVEKGETPTAAVLREIYEELGVRVDAADLEFVCVAARYSEPDEYVGYEFALRDKDYTFVNAEPERCSELVWVEMSDLPDDLVPQFADIIMRGVLGGERLLELGF